MADHSQTSDVCPGKIFLLAVTVCSFLLPVITYISSFLLRLLVISILSCPLSFSLCSFYFPFRLPSANIFIFNSVHSSLFFLLVYLYEHEGWAIKPALQLLSSMIYCVLLVYLLLFFYHFFSVPVDIGTGWRTEEHEFGSRH